MVTGIIAGEKGQEEDHRKYGQTESDNSSGDGC